MIGLLIIVKFTKLLSNLLHFWIIVVVCDLRIWIVLVDAHVHLRHSNLLPRKIAPNSRLHLDDEGQLLHRNTPTQLVVVECLDVANVVYSLS